MSSTAAGSRRSYWTPPTTGKRCASPHGENGTSTREVGELQRLLAGLHRDRQLTESRRLADLVHRGTVKGGRTVLRRLPDRGVRSAMFYVLVGARMPAVLLEASFLSQPEENAALAKREYRIALAHGIAAGILDYARTRTSRR